MDSLVGQRIVAVRSMTDAEMSVEDWDGPSPPALVLDSGAVLYPSRDPEGNGPGALFGHQDGAAFTVRTRTGS